MPGPRREREAIRQLEGGPFRRYWFKVLAVLLAAAFLVIAVIASDASSWLRGAFAAGAVGLLLLARSWEQAAWPDVATLAVAALAAYVALAAAAAEKPTDNEPAETVPFIIPAEKALAATPLIRARPIVVVTLEPDKADSGNVLTYASTRYEASLCHGLAHGKPDRDVAITIERGDADANASAFAADLRAADTIHLLPAAKKKEEVATENASKATQPRLPGCPPRVALVRKPSPRPCRMRPLCRRAPQCRTPPQPPRPTPKRRCHRS